MSAREFEFAGLVGPTHNFAGLSPGNRASLRHGGSVSHPRAAALQSLERMATLDALGVPVVVLPPQPRPLLGVLRRAGFAGGDAEIVEAAARRNPGLLATVYSASCMWTANAATVSPSADTADGRVHLTPANLAAEAHRALEAPFTAAALRRALPDTSRVVHHDPVARGGDEGAANHTRLCPSHDSRGLEVFVHGAGSGEAPSSRGRQSESASRAVAARHRLHPERVCFVRQDPGAIEAGVFHNDVIATGDRDLLFHHEDAFARGAAAVSEIAARFEATCGVPLRTIPVARERLSLADAVATYLFNCQLVETVSGGTAWVGPEQCRRHAGTAELLEELRESGHFESLHFVDLDQSMRNGGGPACLRLRVVLTEAEARMIPAAMRFDETLHAELAGIVERDYRERLSPAELGDPALIVEAERALDAVTEALGLRGVYDFHRG